MRYTDMKPGMVVEDRYYSIRDPETQKWRPRRYEVMEPLAWCSKVKHLDPPWAGNIRTRLNREIRGVAKGVVVCLTA